MINQKGVLIKDVNGNLVEKRTYSGETDNLEEVLKKEGVIYSIFDDDDPIFIAASLPPPGPSLEERLTALENSFRLMQGAK